MLFIKNEIFAIGVSPVSPVSPDFWDEAQITPIYSRG